MNTYRMIVTARVGTRICWKWEDTVYAQNKQDVRKHLRKYRNEILERANAKGGNLSARIAFEHT